MRNANYKFLREHNELYERKPQGIHNKNYPMTTTNINDSNNITTTFNNQKQQEFFRKQVKSLFKKY